MGGKWALSWICAVCDYSISIIGKRLVGKPFITKSRQIFCGEKVSPSIQAEGPSVQAVCIGPYEAKSYCLC